MAKVDKEYYTAKATPALVEFGEIAYLTILGKGEPGGQDFTNSAEALYPLAYGVKFACKAEGKDFVVPKLEGLWWVESDKPFIEMPKSEWHWRLQVRMPDFVSGQITDKAREMTLAKQAQKNESSKIDFINRVIFETMNEGKCVQILHTGPYEAEEPSIAKMREFMEEQGLKENGLHHEIYLSDPRRVVPEKLKTILRQPVK